MIMCCYVDTYKYIHTHTHTSHRLHHPPTIPTIHQAAVGLLMAVALWVIYAGTAGAQGVAVASALHELSEHVSEVGTVRFPFSLLLLGGRGGAFVCLLELAACVYVYQPTTHPHPHLIIPQPPPPQPILIARTLHDTLLHPPTHPIIRCRRSSSSSSGP